MAISSFQKKLADKLEQDAQHKPQAGRVNGSVSEADENASTRSDSMASATPKKVPPPSRPRKKTTKPIKVDTTPPRSHATTTSRHRDTMTPAMVKTVRKAVLLVGKEAATHRFTPEEKQAIGDIVYTYRQQGYKTSENEIARVAINWLVLDYQENGSKSMLERVLKALQE